MIRIKSGFKSGDSVAQVFGDAAPRTDEAAPLFLINPARKGRTLRLLRAVMMMFTLGVLRTAMFTEPAIPQIEKMGRLVHRTLVGTISAAIQVIPSGAPAPPLACRHAKPEPEPFRRSDAYRALGTDRLNLPPCRCQCQQ